MQSDKLYTIRTTKYASDRYGDCDHCHEWASEVFIMAFHTRYNRSPLAGGGIDFTAGSHTFGHDSCLREKAESLGYTETTKTAIQAEKAKAPIIHLGTGTFTRCGLPFDSAEVELSASEPEVSTCPDCVAIDKKLRSIN